MFQIMRRVQHKEIVDYQTYEETRTELQKQVFPAKAIRRVHVGDYFTFLFENALTVRYQVQEMMRTERIVKAKDILHELETYNAILGDEAELGCTLLIEIDDPGRRAALLRTWLRLPEHIYALLEDGTKVRPDFDTAQRGEERISSVQYLKFAVGEKPPVALGIDHPGIEAETRLTEAQRGALAEDLAS
jgi:glycerol-3-phosphate dehydrogenase subunit C